MALLLKVDFLVFSAPFSFYVFEVLGHIFTYSLRFPGCVSLPLLTWVLSSIFLHCPNFYWIFTLFLEVSAYCGTFSQKEILAVWSWQSMWPILLQSFSDVTVGSARAAVISHLQYFFFSFWLHCIFVVAHGLSCPTACGILSPTRDRTCIFRIGRQILIGRQNRWTTREVPSHCWVCQNAPSLGCYFQIGCSCSPGNTYTLFCSFIS